MTWHICQKETVTSFATKTDNKSCYVEYTVLIEKEKFSNSWLTIKKFKRTKMAIITEVSRAKKTKNTKNIRLNNKMGQNQELRFLQTKSIITILKNRDNITKINYSRNRFTRTQNNYKLCISLKDDCDNKWSDARIASKQQSQVAGRRREQTFNKLQLKNTLLKKICSFGVR